MKIRSALAVGALTLGAIALTAIPASASVEAYCGIVVTDPGTFVTLSADLDCYSPLDGGPPGPLPAGTPAITVAASNVTVDLQGHSVRGNPAYDDAGIEVTDAKSTSILNGTIEGFTTGVRLVRAYGVSVSDVTFPSTGYFGVDVQASAAVELSDLTIIGQNWWWVGEFMAGINVADSHDVTVTRVEQSLSGSVGIEIRDSHDFAVTDSKFLRDDADGVALFGALSNGVVQFVAIDGAWTGVNMGGIPDPGVGVTSVALQNVTVSGLRGRDTTTATNRAGVTMIGVHNVTADQVAVSDASYGFLIRNASDNVTITHSSAERSVSHGFIVSNPAGVSSVGLVLHDDRAADNEGSGFVFNHVAVDSAANQSVRNRAAGFQWLGGATGRSRSDLATSNGGNGIAVNNPPTGSVTVDEATASDNAASGLSVAKGTVNVNGGDFSRNASDGVIDHAGALRIAKATANLNSASGVYFASASAGSAAQIHASGNGAYGLAFRSGTTARNLGLHALTGNGVANLCTGLCLG